MSAAAPLMTFLMTDVEGSTRLWEQQREAMATALAKHDSVLRETIEAHHGQLVKSTGDGALASFTRAGEAVAAAVAIERRITIEKWATSEPLLVRVAVHSGEAEERAGDYFGPAVNRTARLLSLGHGGQILISAATAELIRDNLPADLSLVDQGGHRLRGFDRPERVFQLAAPDLPSSFPPLRSERTLRTNLPAQLTSFVGREREIDELRRLVGEHRLITLVGVGGTGKTRLMLQIGAALTDSYRDGVWLAELASVSDARLVVDQINRAFGLAEEPGRGSVETLTDYVRDKQLLLLLDNCEHVLGEVAPLVDHLLSKASSLLVLATSREPLGLQGEVVFPVPSLSLPLPAPTADPDGKPPTLAELQSTEAIRLFVERATAIDSGFKLDVDNAATVADICRRLDGIPLAIELAAARVNVLSVDEIDSRLGDRFRLLTGGRRSALPRQQTLQALIDWSWNLLSETDRKLLRRLSVLSGGWSLAAAARITGDPSSPADELATLDGLSRLAERSLVQVDHGETTRYRLLETIRQYGLERLIEAGEADQGRARHFEFFRDFAQAAEKPLYGPEMVTWLHLLDVDVDNLRSALDWGLEAEPDRALSMLLALAPYWRVRSYGSESLNRLGTAAELALNRPHVYEGAAREQAILAARVAAAAAQAQAAWGSPTEALRIGRAGVEIARATGDRQALLDTLGSSAMAAVFAGDSVASKDFALEAIALGSSAHDPFTLAMVVLGQVTWTALQGDLAVAHEQLARAVETANQSGNQFVIAFAEVTRGRLAGFAGDAAEARAGFARAAALYHEIGDRRFELICRSDLAHALRRSGESAEALALYRETTREWQYLGNRGALAHELECFGFLAITDGRSPRAAKLFGQAAHLREISRMPFMPDEAVEYEQSLASLRQSIDPAAFDEAWQAGREMSLAEAIDYAVGG